MKSKKQTNKQNQNKQTNKQNKQPVLIVGFFLKFILKLTLEGCHGYFLSNE